MDKTYNKLGFLSGSTLKIIACFFMLIDHAGLILFPEYEIMRILGRIAFPIFAFFIAEGSRYSRHKLKRFGLIFSIGIVFLLFYYFYDGVLYGNIFLTFSLSILLDYILISFKKLAVSGLKLYSAAVLLGFVASVLLLYVLYDRMHFEYGFFGMLLPVILNLTNFKDINAPKIFKALDNHYVKILLLIIGLIPLSISGNLGAIQFYCLLAVIPLFFYNGKPGKRGLKYAFYIFYPAHLVIIEGIAMLISYLN